MAGCYICGGKITDQSICSNCQYVHGINTLPEDTQVSFEFDEPTNPGFDLNDMEADFAADEDGAVIATDRWQLLEAMYDECRKLREDGTRTKNGYIFSDRELTDLFVILDALETI